MKKTTLLLVQILVVTTICSAQNFANKIGLNKGQKLYVSSIAKGSSIMQMMGQNMENLSESTSSATIEVKDVTPNSYKLISTVNNMKLKTNVMGQEMNFDSDKKEDMNGEMGQAVKDQFNPKEEEITFAGKYITNNNAAANDEDMKKLMESFSGAGDLGVAGNFLVIPAGKKAGDAWLDSSNANGIKTTNTYTLKQITGNEATVVVNTISKINKTVQAQGAEITMDMDLNASSIDIIDITTGIIKEKRVTTDAKGTLNAAGQEIPMTSKATTVTIVKNAQ